MRLNKFIAQATGLSRRAADTIIGEKRVQLNGSIAQLGDQAESGDSVLLDGKKISNSEQSVITITLNKPTGYVVSRNGQGSKTVYDLLPASMQSLKPVGRLDKNSSGLLLLTNDGELANQLTHPSQHKIKIYELALDKPLLPLHRQMIDDIGITLADGLSKLSLERLKDNDDRQWIVRMHEGRNRQIRRTFEALGYRVTRLHRVQFSTYHLDRLAVGEYRRV
jgi:23S rRNA pseudouridine2605 synthase